MGFSLGTALGGLGAILPSVVPGPIGQIGGAILGGFSGPSPASSAVVPFPGIPGATAVGFTRPPEPVVSGPTQAGLGTVVGMAMRRINVSRAISLVRLIGLELAAGALGVTAIELATRIANRPRRRRRGITASNIRTTKRVLRQVNTLQRQIAEACPAPAARRAALRKK